MLEYEALDTARLEQLYGEPPQASIGKVVDRLNPTYQAWLEQSSFCTIASSSNDGDADCSPRGDKTGHLFRVLDDKHIAIPDRRGNNRIDTLRNIVANPSIGLLFLIPGIRETLRINGQAIVTSDSALRETFAVDGKPPVTVILLQIDAVYYQCARAIYRSALWEEESRPRPADIPSAGKMARSAMADFDSDTYDADLAKRQLNSLY